MAPSCLVFFITLCVCLVIQIVSAQEEEYVNYLMYVWNDGFFGGGLIHHGPKVKGASAPISGGKDDTTGEEQQDEEQELRGGGHRELPPVFCPGATSSYFDEDVYPQCFKENWNNWNKRRALWGSVRTEVPPERRVSHILLSKVSDIILDCNHPDANTLRRTLKEAHAPAVRVKVYALFSSNDITIPDADKVPDVVAWNRNCARCPNERFDGVAINNEAYTGVKCTAGAAEADILTRIHEAKVAAHAGGLKLHMSLGWHWGWCSATSSTLTGIPNNVAWAPPGGGPAVSKPANQHFLDILDSADAQVSWNVAATMANRAIMAGSTYAETLGKPFWVLAYTNPNDDCRFTFFPTPLGCTQGDLTEAGMWDAFDDIEATLPSVHGGIHYFRGAYSTGLTGWPKHVGGSFITEACHVQHIEKGPQGGGGGNGVGRPKNPRKRESQTP